MQLNSKIVHKINVILTDVSRKIVNFIRKIFMPFLVITAVITLFFYRTPIIFYTFSVIIHKNKGNITNYPSPIVNLS